MDTRDLLILGGLGFAGWCAFKWWQGRPAANQAQAPSTDVQGAAASQMTGAAARSTVFGGATATRNLLTYPALQLRPKSGIPPASGTLADWEMSTNPIQRGFVLNAVLGPLPVAPSPNNNRYFSPDGGLAGAGSAPHGSPPDQGDPTPTFTNPFGTRGLL